MLGRLQGMSLLDSSKMDHPRFWTGRDRTSSYCVDVFRRCERCNSASGLGGARFLLSLGIVASFSHLAPIIQYWVARPAAYKTWLDWNTTRRSREYFAIIRTFVSLPCVIWSCNPCSQPSAGGGATNTLLFNIWYYRFESQCIFHNRYRVTNRHLYYTSCL